MAILQNAWGKEYAGRRWPRKKWLAALHASRSGQRIRTLISACEGLNIWFDNTTPIVGDNPDSVIAPDLEHVKRVLDKQRPDAVVAFGAQAARVLRPVAKVPLLIVPHPAYRVVTNELYRQAGIFLSSGFEGVLELRQCRGAVKVVK